MSVHADSEIIASRQSFFRRWGTPITASAALLAATTLVLWLLDARLQQNHLIFVYFVPTALITIRFGSVSAMCVAIVAAFAAAFLFYSPRFSFMVDSPLELLELIFFSLLALLACQVVSGFASGGDVQKRRLRKRTASLRARWPAAAAMWDRLGR
ncbi:MAG: DUF4118 domain-containing protein [Hyphomicrobiales bacterium]